MSDIKIINGKFYDFAPQNQSFLQTAAELKALGIKNYYFMLEIKNPNVININPYNDHISKAEIEALMMELKSNIWFYARTIARLRSDAGVVQFGLHRGLCAAIWAFTKGFDSCLCEPRQTWKTSGMLATVISWAFQLSQNLNIHFFGKDSENTKRNLSILRDDIELLPQWLQFRRFLGDDSKVKKSRWSAEILENKLLHNKVTIHPKPSSRSHAQGMGRGASAAILYMDEVEHTPYFDEILSNSAPAFKTASENARKAGQPTGRILTCTP